MNKDFQNIINQYRTGQLEDFQIRNQSLSLAAALPAVKAVHLNGLSGTQAAPSAKRPGK